MPAQLRLHAASLRLCELPIDARSPVRYPSVSVEPGLNSRRNRALGRDGLQAPAGLARLARVWLDARRSTKRLAVTAVGALGLGAACASVLGIEESDCDPAFSLDCACPPGRDLCDCYCDLVESNCRGLKVYADPASCQALCPIIRDSVALGQEGLECRVTQAALAGSESDTVTRGQLCLAAGPSGRAQNGAFCDADSCVPYCAYLEQTCGEEYSTCVEQCQLTRDANVEFDQAEYVADVNESSGATLQCRIYHANNAAREDFLGDEAEAAFHCTHALGAPPCN